MPDGDRFERSLRGRGWAKAYRLAGGKAEWPLLIDALVTASAFALRHQAQSPSLSDVASALSNSLAFRRGHDSDGGFGAFEAFEQLYSQLDEIEARDLNRLGTSLVIRAAKKVFAEQGRQIEPPEKQQTTDRLGEEFFCELIDQQFLSRVREGIAEQNERSVEQQASWEQELKQRVRPQARKLFASALKAANAKEVRAPNRIAVAPPLEVQLHRPLVALDR